MSSYSFKTVLKNKFLKYTKKMKFDLNLFRLLKMILPIPLLSLQKKTVIPIILLPLYIHYTLLRIILSV